jgi:hypothetical protein
MCKKTGAAMQINTYAGIELPGEYPSSKVLLFIVEITGRHSSAQHLAKIKVRKIREKEFQMQPQLGIDWYHRSE